MAMMTLEEFLARFKAGYIPSSDPSICELCTLPITGIEDKMEPQFYSGKWVHADCYFDKLSDLIEEYPIRTPRVRHIGRPD